MDLLVFVGRAHGVRRTRGDTADARARAPRTPSTPRTSRDPTGRSCSCSRRSSTFPGSLECVGTTLVPALGILLVLFVPWLDRGTSSAPAKRPVAIGVFAVIVAVLAVLTWLGAQSAPAPLTPPAGRAAAHARIGGQHGDAATAVRPRPRHHRRGRARAGDLRLVLPGVPRTRRQGRCRRTPVRRTGRSRGQPDRPRDQGDDHPGVRRTASTSSSRTGRCPSAKSDERRAEVRDAVLRAELHAHPAADRRRRGLHPPDQRRGPGCGRDTRASSR